MVDQINGVGAGQHVAPKKGMKMSDLEKTNKLLFDYFKKQGFKDDGYVLDSDIQELKAQMDANGNEKISVREARKIGLDGKRKEVKAAISTMDTVANTEIAKDTEVPEKIDDNNTDYYKNGFRTKSVYKDDHQELVKEYERDGKTLKEVRSTNTVEGETTVEKTVYCQGSKSYTETNNSQLKIFTKYIPDTDKPERSIVTWKNDEGELDNDSTKTIVYSNYGEGKARTETITYTGKMIENGITECTVEYDKDGIVIKNTTNLDEADASDGANEVAKDTAQGDENTAKTRPAFTPLKQKVHLPNEWKNQRLSDGVAEELKLGETYTADEVLDKLSVKFGIKKDEIQADKLNADLIKYNPSVFDKEGKVFEGADFGKLDFPQNAGELYKNGVEPPKVKVRRNNPPAPPKAPVRPKAEEVKADATPAIPCDPNPPKQDASGMIIYQFHATGPKNGIMGDINGNVYHYDEKGRLRRIKNKNNKTIYEYSYNKGNLKLYLDYTNDHTVIRDKQGRVLEYFDGKLEIWRFGNGVAQPSGGLDRYAKVEDFNLDQEQFEKDNNARNAAEQRRIQRNQRIADQARADRTKKS